MIASLILSAVFALAAPSEAGGKEAKAETEGEAAAVPVARAPLQVSGSSTVAPFVLVLTNGLEAVDVRITSSGTTAGLAALCDLRPGSADLTGGSRGIAAAELDDCAAAGVSTVVEVPLGTDGIVLAHSDAAEPLALTATDLYRALAAERPRGDGDCTLLPNTARRWSDVRADLPARPIRVFGPPPTSGTREVFAERVIAEGARAEPCLAVLARTDPARFAASLALRRDAAWTEAGESDGAVAYALTRLPDAIGVFGFVHAAAQEGLALVPIDGVAPTRDAIADGRYPLARPLYLYTTAGHLTRDPRVIEVIRGAVGAEAVGEGGVLSGMGLIASEGAGSAFLIDTRSGERTALPLGR